MSTVIQTQGLSKAYQLGEFSTGTLSRDIERLWYQLRGKEDPFLKIGETNDRSVKGSSPIVWSLKDINFNIEQGDAVGIIGRNGAGKSTLLKILSRVTTPTTGSVKMKGRIASLLEVGTGFHPELTGRENIFLNGAILGMRKAEIKRKFDEIVDFSGVERYIDTPVKRYSSGMYVRLAFAVAAHLESEILIVDEVLAVGDAEFQKKCLGKMNDVSKGQGRTVLFVSHDMRAIKALCTSAIFLKNGQTEGVSPVGNALLQYSSAQESVNPVYPVTIDELVISDFSVTQNGYKLQEYQSELPITIDVDFELREPLINFRIGIFLKSNQGDTITAPLLADWRPELETFSPGRYHLHGNIPANLLLGGSYLIELHCSIHGIKNFQADRYATQMVVVKSPSQYNINHMSEPPFGYIIVNPNWQLAKQ